MNLKLRTTDERRSSYLKIAVLVLSLAAAGILVFRQVDRWTSEAVWVAASELVIGQIVKRQDLEKIRLRGDVPVSAVAKPRQIIGKRLIRAKNAGDVFVADDLAAKEKSASVALRIPEGRVLSTVRVPSLSLPYPDLRRGDRLEVVAAARGGARTVAGDAVFIGTITPAEKTDKSKRSGLFDLDLSPLSPEGGGGGLITLMLALHPDDAIPVARAQATQARLSLVLQGRGERLELPSSKPDRVELISGAKRAEINL